LFIKKAVPGLHCMGIYAVALGLVYTALNFRKNVPALGGSYIPDLTEIRCVPVAHQSGILLDVTAISSSGECRLFLSAVVLNGQLLLRPCHNVPCADIFLQIQARYRWALQRAQMLDKTGVVATKNVSALCTELQCNLHCNLHCDSTPTELLMTPGFVVETTAEERTHIATISQFHIADSEQTAQEQAALEQAAQEQAALERAALERAALERAAIGKAASCTAACTVACAATLVAALRRLQDLLYQPDVEARLAPIALYYVRRLCCHGDAGVRAAALDLIGTLSL